MYARVLAAVASASWASRSACSGSPCAIATRARVVSASDRWPAARRRDGFVGPAPGRGQIPARQRGLGNVSAKDCRHRGLDTDVVPARRECVVRRGSVTRGEYGGGQRHIAQALVPR